MHLNVGEKRVKGKMRRVLLQSGDTRTSDPLWQQLTAVLHTISARTGFGASPGCREVVTWRLEAFPPAWRGGGSPGWWEPVARGPVARGARRRWDMGCGSFPGSPGRARSGAACLEPRWGHVCSAPPRLSDHPHQTRLPASRVSGTPGTALTPEAKAPEGERDSLWATHQVEGSFHYFHRPPGERWPEEGEPRRRGTWTGTAREHDAAPATETPLRAPGASGGRGRRSNRTTSSSGAAGPACAAATHASWRHTRLVQGGGEGGEWVGLREGGARTLSRGWSIPLARSVSSASWLWRRVRRCSLVVGA